MRVLYVASNPDQQATLLLEHEITELQRTAAGLSAGAVEFIFLPSLPFEDLPAQISKYKPDIVHISAHGDDGARQLIGRVSMAIGTTAPITNRAASKAAANFYIRLLEGKSVNTAFETCKMIMKGLNSVDIDAVLFSHPRCDPSKQFMHVATRLAARFWKDKSKAAGSGDYKVEIGLVGVPRNTTQVVFFTDDETFIAEKKDTLEIDLCAVARTTAIRGEIWLGYDWETYGDFRLFACGITAGGEHYSVAGSLCNALETYYISHKKSVSREDTRNPINRAIADLRSQDGGSGAHPIGGRL